MDNSNSPDVGDDEVFADDSIERNPPQDPLVEAAGAKASIPLQDLADRYLPHLYRLDGPTSPSLTCTGCDTEDKASFRCLDCFDSQEYCSPCMQERHRVHPLHRIQHWAGTHFERSSLKEAGMLVGFGHGPGEACSQGEVLDFIVVDVSGIHSIRASFCRCGSHSRIDQLFERRLFPSTPKQPRMAFTFSVLDFFRTFNLISKTAVYDFVKSLTFLTDPVQPDKVSVCVVFHEYLSILIGFVYSSLLINSHLLCGSGESSRPSEGGMRTVSYRET